MFVAAAKPAQPPAQWKGQIVRYTGTELELKTSLGTIKKFPAARIVRVEVPLLEDHKVADAMFARGQHSQALARYDAAERKDSRVWMRRRMIAQKVWCYRALGQYARAGEQFIVLYQSDPTTQLVDCAPLAWGAEPFSRAVEQRAQVWLSQGRSSVEWLLGASHCLSTASRGEALERLKRLTTDGDANIAMLAQAQLWRSQLVTADPRQVAAWQQAIENMRPPLRAGPYYVLGRALVRHKQFEAAALAFLRVPTLYENNRALSAASLLEAGSALESLSRNAEARKLFQQLVREHPQSQSATEARRRLQKLSGS